MKDYPGTQSELVNSYGKRFVAQADVRNFFPSIYSHSIPWAFEGRDRAKKHKGSDTAGNRLDLAFQLCRRNETHGVAIGPGTSNIAAEIILGRVDAALELRGHKNFYRFIDDYHYFADTDTDANAFIDHLRDELHSFELSLNDSKTMVTELPSCKIPSWIHELHARLPRKSTSTKSYYRFIEGAIDLSRMHPDGSVLRYTFRLIMDNYRSKKANYDLAESLIDISFHRPYLVPQLCTAAERGLLDPAPFGGLLNQMLVENAKRLRSDVTAWLLHLCKKYNIELTSDTIESVIQAKDPIAIAYLVNDNWISSDDIDELLQDLINSAEQPHILDRHWILLYELFRRSSLPKKIKGDQLVGFDILRENNVKFINS